MKLETDLDSMDNFFTWLLVLFFVGVFIFGVTSCANSVVKYEEEKLSECELIGGVLIMPKYGESICVKEAKP